MPLSFLARKRRGVDKVTDGDTSSIIKCCRTFSSCSRIATSASRFETLPGEANRLDDLAVVQSFGGTQMISTR